MKRKSTAVSGWVNFPIDDPTWQNSQEGGMFVKLVVCDNREYDDRFGLCCGATVTDLLVENLVGDDRRPIPGESSTFESVEQVEAEIATFAEWEGYHFPRCNDSDEPTIERYLSRDYLTSLIIGTTGWSGCHAELGTNWVCHFKDLTEEGQALYRQVEKLYPGCELHLLTFLDT